jgi:hypothetical protein
MRFSVYFAALLLMASFVGCAKNPVLEIPADEPEKVYDRDSKTERLLLPGSADHRRFSEWIANHQGGWKQHLSTPPAQGVIVRTRQINLQFIDTIVLAKTAEGIFEHAITLKEYAFLREQDGASHDAQP